MVALFHMHLFYPFTVKIIGLVLVSTEMVFSAESTLLFGCCWVMGAHLELGCLIEARGDFVPPDIMQRGL